MYWPCSFRLARRAGDSLSFRPRRPGLPGPRVVASSADAKRASARTIAPSDLRMAWTSLPTDPVRPLCKRGLHGSHDGGEWYYGASGVAGNRPTAWLSGTPVEPMAEHLLAMGSREAVSHC